MCRAARDPCTLPSAPRPSALSSHSFVSGLALLLLVATGAPASAQNIASTQEYRFAIEQARSGRHAWALDWLARQSRMHPEAHYIKHDQLIISSWAGNYREAIRLYESLPAAALPLPRAALAAAARAYRDNKQWAMALRLYREGKQRFPGDDTFSLGETLVLADSGDASKALDVASSLVQHAPRDPRSHLVQSYAYRLNQQPYAALQSATKAYRLAPQNPAVAHEYIDALSGAGLSESALRTARTHVETVSPERIRTLEADRAAELTRLASRPARQDANRYVLADRALQTYQELEEEQAQNAQADQTLRLRIDRLVALHSRALNSQVVQEYEALESEGVSVPPYALGHVASAYLDLRQPAKAAELYQAALRVENEVRVDPAVRLSHQSGLFYSFVESERFDLAENTISQAQQEQPPWFKAKGTPILQPNELSVDAGEQAALADLYADNTPEAQKQLEQLVDIAPRHAGLRSSLAEVYLARGWPRRAEEELKIAETHSPRALTVITEQAEVAMSLQEWKQAEQLIEYARSKHPENAHVRRLVRDWDLHNRSELIVSAQQGLASDSPVAGDGDLRLDAVIYTPPIDYNWRGFAGGGYASADFDGADVDYHWFRAGAQWRSRDLTAEVEVSSNHYGQGAKVGARAQVAYDLDDQWQMGAQVAFRSRETPLRALANNITSNRADVYVQWRQNERREWRLVMSPSRFSDGNRRIEGLIAGRERLHTSPHVKLDAHLDVAASHNSREDAPYFNPRADFTVLPSLSLTHTLYRRYDTVLEQRFMAGAGLYAQRGYGSGAIATLGYGLNYRFDNRVEAGLSVTGVSRPYDGRREREARVMFDLKIRF